MAILLDELTPMRMYRGNFFYPINMNDRMNNSVIYLMTPNRQSSIDVMNYKQSFQGCKTMFRSYFVEKSIQFIINRLAVSEGTSNSPLTYDINGIQYDYTHPILEALDVTDQNPVSINDTNISFNTEDRSSRIFFPESVEDILDESMTRTRFGSYNFDMIFKNILFSHRMRNQQECMQLYREIRSQVPYLMFTFSEFKLYKNRNMFYDWSYYTEPFFKNLPSGYTAERGIDLLFAYMNRFLEDRRFDSYTKKTIVVPVHDWANGINNPLDYTESINPLSMIYRSLRNRPEMIRDQWGKYLFLFMGKDIYFTMNFANFDYAKDYGKFTSVLRRMLANDVSEVEPVDQDSRSGIMIQLSDMLADRGEIQLTNLTGGTRTLTKSDLENMGLLKNPDVSDDVEVKKAALVSKMQDVVDKSVDAKEAEKNLLSDEDPDEADWIKNVLMDIEENDGGVKMSAARVARMEQSRKDILNKEVKGKSVASLINDFKTIKSLAPVKVPVDSIDESWNDIKFASFNKDYHMTPDIVAMFHHFTTVTHPMNMVSIDSENTSTSEDYKETWTVQYEDAETGKRQTIKVDIPILIGDRFMKLRGNEKVLIGQLMLLPIIKTADDVVQMVSNYNKIFIRRKSPSGFGKSSPIINKLIKALDKYDGKDMKIMPGDNTKVNVKYSLPVEFIDISALYSRIIFKDKSYISFNVDDLKKLPIDKSVLPKDKQKLSDENIDKLYLSVYVNSDGKRVPIVDSVSFGEYLINKILSKLDKDNGTFEKLYRETAIAKRLMYSEASIMNTTIPVVVVLSYNIGLQKLLNKINVKYSFSEKKPATDKDTSVTYIKFNDGYLSWTETTTEQNMLLNGLMECDFTDFSIREINGKDMWLSVLDDFGGRIKADGLDNFYDLMFDPITKEICNTLKIPDNYVDGMLYANKLLIDNKFNKHTDISGNRLRTNEVIVGHLYMVLAKAYGAYRNMVKRNKGSAGFSCKQSAVIDSILNHDQTSSDLSTLNPLLEAEAASKVTFKGLSGMNSDRAFSLDKRTYDESMLGVLGLSTGFASTVGINRQTTINANVLNHRGFIGKVDTKKLNNTKTFTMMEAISPLAVNHDDPMRTCMAFTQTVQHQMMVKKSMPNLVTNGADEALPYLTSDKFAHKFKSETGTVVEVTEDYMITRDTKTGECDYIDLRETIQKNSDGGFYVTTKLDPIVKKGDKLRRGQIIAYNKACYSNAAGAKSKDNISYNIGTLAKVAIMETDLGYEDSCVVDHTISEAMMSEVVVMKDVSLSKNTNVYNVLKVGTVVQEGDPLLIFQDAFDEKEANELLQSLAQDNDMLSDLGRKQIHAKVSGVIQDIKIYRTCELDVLSPTLKKVCKEYDAKIDKYKKVMSNYKIDKQYTLESTGKLAQEGKLKGLDGVRIEFYIKVEDKFGIGDKLVFGQALKGVNSYIIQEGEESTSEYRPNEHVNAFLTIGGVMGRMVASSQSIGLMNKLLIELARQSQEDLGIKWRPMQDILTDKN